MSWASWEESGRVRKREIRKERCPSSAKVGTWNLPTEPAQVPDFSFPSMFSPGILETTKEHHPTAIPQLTATGGVRLSIHLLSREREPVQE